MYRFSLKWKKTPHHLTLSVCVCDNYVRTSLQILKSLDHVFHLNLPQGFCMTSCSHVWHQCLSDFEPNSYNIITKQELLASSLASQQCSLHTNVQFLSAHSLHRYPVLSEPSIAPSLQDSGAPHQTDRLSGSWICIYTNIWGEINLLKGDGCFHSIYIVQTYPFRNKKHIQNQQ